MNKVEYWLIVILATVLTLITEVGIPFIVVGLGAMAGLWEFSWITVIIAWIIEQTFLDIKHTTTLLAASLGNKNNES